MNPCRRLACLAFIASFLGLGLAGCASTGEGTFQPSVAAEAATVHARSHRDSLFVWERLQVLSIDGKFIRSGLFTSDDLWKVDPGERRFVVDVAFNRGWNTGPFQAIVPIQATLRPGASYRLRSEVREAEVAVWLEDDADPSRVSPPGSAAWRRAPPPPVVVPIFIPAR